MTEAIFKGPGGVLDDAAMLRVDIATAHCGEHAIEKLGNVPIGFRACHRVLGPRP